MRYRPAPLVMLALSGAVGLLLLTGARAGAKTGAKAGDDQRLRLPASELSEEQRILHALNRLAYGPRPGDVRRVGKLGLATWIEQQLDPFGIEDGAVEGRLAGYDTLNMPPTELLVRYPQPAMLRRISRQLTTRMGMDPESVNELFPELDRRKKADETGKASRKKKKKKGDPPGEAMMQRGPQWIVRELSQAKLVRATYSERQLQEVMTDFWFNHFNVYVGKGVNRWWTTSYERDAIRPHALGNFREMLGAVARHPAMLSYLDNWTSTAPGTRRSWRIIVPYTAEVIRDQGLPPGGVATLLLRERGMKTGRMERELARREARARQNRGSAPTNRRPPQGEEVAAGGLNENYARELLELHTLGVDGGYTQQDIVEIARCFTGWTFVSPTAGQSFVFVDELHDHGKKVVLGKKIKKDNGIREGEAVLDLLARHPSTAHFISTKLARRFVSDEPPAALVERMAQQFMRTDGDIRVVLRTLFASEEFWSPDSVRAKIKTPLEFVVSAVRATDAELVPARMRGLLQVLRRLGQPLYAAQPPTGYKDTADAWISTGALLQRLKIALGLPSNRVPGVRVDIPDDIEASRSTELLVDLTGLWLFGQAPSSETLEIVRQQLDLPPEELQALGLPPTFSRARHKHPQLVAGWLLATPEFQRR